MMNTPTVCDQRCLADLAQLYDYPQSDYMEMALETCEKLCGRCCPEAAWALAEFGDEIVSREIGVLEELHTRTFSLSPVCVPYVGVQLFGENNFKRGEFLGGLSLMCGRYSLDISPELPDHIASMLHLAALVPHDELDELLTWCLCPAAEKMSDSIDRLTTPYRYLVRATDLILKDLQKRVHNG